MAEQSILIAATLTIAAVSHAQPLRAEYAVFPPTDEIIVTAQRRPESQSSVPAAITVLSGVSMEAADLPDVRAIIRFTPGFSGYADNNFVDGITIRGIASNDYGLGGDPSIGVFRDGIHQGRTGSVITTAYDLQRVEALRGPQVFLFGRNAISGIVSIVTVAPDPDRSSGDATGRIGTRDRMEAQGAYNAALGNGWAVRVAGDRETENGSIDNVAFPQAQRLGARDVTAARVSLLHRGAATTVRLTAEYENRELGGTPHRAQTDDLEVFDLLRTVAPALAIGGDGQDVDSDLPSLVDHTRVGSLTLRIDHDAGGWMLSSLTGLRMHRYRYREDYDGTPLEIDTYGVREHGSYASQEFTAVSGDGGPLTWSLGVSGYAERVKGRFTNSISEAIVCGPGYGYADCDALAADLLERPYVPAPDGALTDINLARGVNWGVSAYAEAGWSATATLSFGAGARVTRDHKRFSLDVPPVASSLGNIWLSTYYTEGYLTSTKTWDGVSPRIYARWQPSREWTLYASATRGTKAGGFGTFSLIGPEPLDGFAVAPVGTRPDDYDEETVTSLEFGIKRRLAGRGMASLTAFHYLYRDLQANIFDPALRSTQVINIGRVYGTGIEAEAMFAVNAYFDLSIEGAWIRTRKTGDRDCALRDCGGLGNPVLSGGAIARAHAPTTAGEIYIQAEASYTGKARRSFDDRGWGRVPVCGRGDMRIGYAATIGWRIEGYVRNVTNAICYGGVDNGGGTSPATRWAPIAARTAGLAVSQRF